MTGNDAGGVERTLLMVTNPWLAALGGGMVLAAAVLGWWAWRRSGWSRRIGLLEVLRLLCVALVAVTLNQPEWRESFPPAVEPEVVVLWDESGSMDTVDVPHDGGVRSRKEAVRAWTEPERWRELASRYGVVFQSFSGRSGAEAEPGTATDLHGALESVRERATPPAAVVLLSDGDWNAGGSPESEATKLRLREVPVFAVAVGSEVPLPDIAVTRFDVPTFAVQGKSLRMPYALKSTLTRDQAVQVRCWVDEEEIHAETLVLPAMGSLELGVSWRPEAAGDHRVRLEVGAVEGEAVAENNAAEARLSVRPEELKVLVIESYPRWEYRYLRNALERDPGVEASCLLFHPDLDELGAGEGYLGSFPTDEELVDYDVVLLGDVGIAEGQLTEGQARRLAQLVRNQASGLIFLPGFRGGHLSLAGSPLEELYPVVLDPAQPRGWGSPVPGRLQLTELGQRSLLTRLEDGDAENAEVWENLPGFQWYAPIVRAKAGSEILARHGTDQTDYGRIPLIVTKTYGAGKILFMGTDGAWRWRKGVEDRFHYRFWGQVARWMAYQRNMANGETMRLFFSPDRPKAGDTVSLNANVMSPGGEPLQEGTVIVEFLSPSGRTDRVRLLPGGEENWGLFTGTFVVPEAGEYRLRLTSAEQEETLETVLVVSGDVLEKTGQPARPAVLEAIARLTRGRLVTPDEFGAVIEAVRALPDPPPVEHRVRIWAHWAWMLLLVTLLSAFWIGRKWAGAV